MHSQDRLRAVKVVTVLRFTKFIESIDRVLNQLVYKVI